MPKVSYIKAMDIFLGICFIFVFIALIELAVMKELRETANAENVRTKNKKRKLRRSITQPASESRRKFIRFSVGHGNSGGIHVIVWMIS